MTTNTTQSNPIPVRGYDSRDLERWVCEHSTLSYPYNLVAGKIAGFVNKTDGYAFPTYALLEEQFKISETTLYRVREIMETSGEWVVLTGRGGPGLKKGNGSPRANRYYPTAKLLEGIDEWLKGRGKNIPTHEIRVPVLKPFEIVIKETFPDRWQEYISSPASNRQKVEVAAKTLEDSGYSVSTRLAQTLIENRQEIKSITGWLATFGFTLPHVKENTDGGAFTDMLPPDSFQEFLNGLDSGNIVDYAARGQDL